MSAAAAERAAFLEARRAGIGGSDMAAILGLDPWKQAIDVFYDKRPDLAEEHGYQPREDAEDEDLGPRFWGSILEDPIAEGYAKRTGRKVQRSNVQHALEQAPYMLANIDRRVVGEKRGVEIKNVSLRMSHLWGPDGTDEVASYYLPQVCHYMLVLDMPVWDVAALIGGSELRIYTVERDPEMDQILLNAGAEFWSRVEAGTPPPVDPEHKRAAEVLRRVYPGTNGETVALGDDAQRWAEVMWDAQAQAKQYQAVVDGARAHLQAMAGAASVATLPGGGGFVRKVVKRKGYEVEPSEYVDFRFNKKAGE
ncbi:MULTISPECIES: YqaJ viral recombinase family protein [unclassified Thioalkalivibrio]|uniref:YqaJ viral recombinase family nuclease n=1 Tax=unclassified Thioalkalivibrio TaxID=2621013 RepID=UPI00037050A0|nr:MULTISPECIES: YqaJ viral recombinase family protein [unclassified Thioalkalivibrio]